MKMFLLGMLAGAVALGLVLFALCYFEMRQRQKKLEKMSEELFSGVVSTHDGEPR